MLLNTCIITVTTEQDVNTMMSWIKWHFQLSNRPGCPTHPASPTCTALSSASSCSAARIASEAANRVSASSARCRRTFQD